MIYKNIELREQRSSVSQCKSVFRTASFGEVIKLERMRSNREFTATIHGTMAWKQLCVRYYSAQRQLLSKR